MRRLGAIPFFAVGGMLIFVALAGVKSGGAEAVLVGLLFAVSGSALCWFALEVWKGRKQSAVATSTIPLSSQTLSLLLLAAGTSTAAVTYASNVAVERLTFNCFVEDCGPDGYLLVMPLLSVLFWSIAAATSTVVKTRALAVSLVVVGVATALNFVSALSAPPDPDKSFVAASVLFMGLILGLPIGWLLGLAGGWLGSWVIRTGMRSFAGRMLGGVGGASAVVLITSLWLPWIRVHRQFGDSSPHVLSGIEVANAGRVLLVCGSLIVLAFLFFSAGQLFRVATRIAVLASSAALGTLVWVLLNNSLFVAAHQVISPGDNDFPLRLTDLGTGVPLAVAATTLALSCSVLGLRATGVEGVATAHQDLDGSMRLADPDPAS